MSSNARSPFAPSLSALTLSPNTSNRIDLTDDNDPHPPSSSSSSFHSLPPLPRFPPSASPHYQYPRSSFTVNPSMYLPFGTHHPHPTIPRPPSSSQPPRREQDRQIIDLTDSRTPSPVSQQPYRTYAVNPSSTPLLPQPNRFPPIAPHNNHSHHHHHYPQQKLQIPQPHPPPPPTFTPDLSPKTPVCIGQLTVTALILYPVQYLHSPKQGGGPDADWAPVRLAYEHNPRMTGEKSHTIHISAPATMNQAGHVIAGEQFALVEQKVANKLGPMMSKGLIKMEARVRRGQPSLPILPLQLLILTPKGNINVIGNYLRGENLLLDHPSNHFMFERYQNPHDPPPGGWDKAITMHSVSKLGVPGSGSRWAQAPPAKAVDTQRTQVDELFKNIQEGDTLQETDPPPQLSTCLYPHQKKALTFLLEREREKRDAQGNFPSLWQLRVNPGDSTSRVWHHIVTQEQRTEEPKEAKGSILADDMGLGKTITCVALVAATMSSAQEFARQPLEPLPPVPVDAQEPPLTAAHFAGSVWGMPEASPFAQPPSAPMSKKAQAKAAKEQSHAQVQYSRAIRIKFKSRATLIVCPLSTVANWEDQFREHWKGEVTVVGGGSGATPVNPSSSTASGASSSTAITSLVKPQPCSDVLRIYIYHGNARRLDPAFLADFDIVITTYATLASEYSKQTKSCKADGEEDDSTASDKEIGSADLDEKPGEGTSLSKRRVKACGQKRKKPCGATSGEASSPLQSVHWFRVVLDEAHSIKEVGTVACKACCDLMADRRLCLTGTPVQNKLDDVFALLKFLRLAPFDDKNVWTQFIGAPAKYMQEIGIVRLRSIMNMITLRRTKDTKAADGRSILSLPPRTDVEWRLTFDETEQKIYTRCFEASQAEFQELKDKNEVMKNYVSILQTLLRLRQICDHYELLPKEAGGSSSEPEQSSYDEVVKAIKNEGITSSRASIIFSLLRDSATAQCAECGYDFINADTVTESVEECTPAPAKRGRKPKGGSSSKSTTRANSPCSPIPVLTRCQHLFCIACYRSCVCPGWPCVQPDTRRCCSVCQTGLAPAEAVQIDPATTVGEQPGRNKKKMTRKEMRAKGLAPGGEYHPSTKIRTLVSDLMVFSKENPHSANFDPSSVDVQMLDREGNAINNVVKSVVFSQWTSMLDKIEDALDACNIRFDRLDGTMKREDRVRAMDALKNDPSCEVLLVSLKAGGVGLNLTAAQRVYLMDPYWNPAVENQAVDRIHRLGQTRPVTAITMIMENSVEQKLLDIKKKKVEYANMTLGQQKYSKEEMAKRRIQELNEFFS